MTYKQFIDNISKSDKQFFKCVRTKDNKIIYTVADNIDHCISRFNNWNISIISAEEFVNNYPFTKD